MANTLEHKVLYTVHGETIERELKFASAKNAVNIAIPYVKDRLWTNVHFQQLTDGTWAEDKESQVTLMSKAGNAKKETSMSAVPALIQLGELVGVLEKSAAKTKLTDTQQLDLLTDAMNALKSSGLNYVVVLNAVHTAYDIPLPPSGNDATEKVPAIPSMPQIAATPRETLPQEKPQERLHVQVPDKESSRGGGLFGRKP